MHIRALWIVCVTSLLLSSQVFGRQSNEGTDGAQSGMMSASSNDSTTSESFTLSANPTTIDTIAGSAPSTATITVNPVNGFNAPLIFSCTDPALESLCTMSPPIATIQPQVTLSITTTAPTSRLRPFGRRGMRVFYAALLPGFMGICLTGGSQKRFRRTARLLGRMAVLGVSTIGLLSCGNTLSNSNPGTPKQAYTITVNATTVGANPITGSTQVTLNVQ